MACKAVVWLSSLAIFLLVFSSVTAQVKSMEMHRSLASNEIADALLKFFKSFETTQILNSADKVYSCIKQKDLNQSKQYLDAIGKPPSGIFSGNLLWLGSFDSCQDISGSHYCLLFFNVTILNNGLKTNPTYLPIKLGSCVPNTCTTNDVQGIVELLLALAKNHTHFLKNVIITYQQSVCPEKPRYTTDVIVTLVFCGFLLFLCLLGTIVDVITGASSSSTPVPQDNPRKEKFQTSSEISKESIDRTPFASSQHLYINESRDTTDMSGRERKHLHIKGYRTCLDFFLCFSLVGNTKKIFATNVPAVAITSINGLRVISMSWVILGHTFLLMVLSNTIQNPVDMLKDTTKLSTMVILNGYFSVDSFFFLSGLLVAYTCLRKMEKNDGKFNWILFYVHRYWRLTPSLMFVILFYMKLRPILMYSPLWNTKDSHDPCDKYWWTNLIYINNFYPTESTAQCLDWSWYLANDMQFFVITPVFLILAYSFGWRGLLASAGSLLLVSSITIAALIGFYNLDPMTLGRFIVFDTKSLTSSAKTAFENKMYEKPYCRVQPYLVGFFLGYFMHRSFSGTRRPGWLLVLLGWLVAAAVGMSLVYAPHDDVVPDGRRWTKAENVIYGTLERLLWGGVLAWVTYACHYGYGGLIQQFLSTKFWIPLSRLTYSAYLVHPIVLMFMFNGVKSTIFYSYITLSYYFIAGVVLSYAAGFILAVTVEFPCDSVEKLVLKALRIRF